MDITRRSFIRWVIASSPALACPLSDGCAGRPQPTASPRTTQEQLHSEDHSVCHDVRDHRTISPPAPNLRCGVVIVGGGPSGLAAADELSSTDFLLLEKEPHFGGNAYSESWEGCTYSTAAAWESNSEPELAELAKRWKFDWKEIQGYDTVCYNGVWIRDFWTGRPDNPAFDKLPFKRSVRDGFQRFLRDIEVIDLERNIEEIDTQTFAHILKSYPHQLKAFWDAYGAST